MRRALIVGLLVSMTVLLAPVRAQVKAHYTIYGVGTKSCGYWIEGRSSGNTNFLLSWVLGFVSGAASQSVSSLKDTDSDGMQSFIDQYCDAHRLDRIDDAAQALVIALRVKLP